MTTMISSATTKTFDANKTIGKYENEMTAAELAQWLELDTPSAADRARYAAIDALLTARKAAGVQNGRDWTGVLVAHADNCICNGCVSDQIWKECAVACGLPSTSGRRILVSNTALPHTSAQCAGKCRSHPLLDAAALAFRAQEDLGLLWGDIAELDHQAARARETPAQRIRRLEVEAAAAAASDAAIVRYSVNKKADKWCKGGDMKFRVPRCCKYESLFAERTCAGCGAKVPEGQTKCQAKKGHQVCGETLAGCWSHTKGQCIYVHPDEAQWNDAVSGALCYDRDAQRFFLRGEEPARPAAPSARDFSGLGSGARAAPRHEERRDQARPSPLGRAASRRPQTDGW